MGSGASASSVDIVYIRQQEELIKNAIEGGIVNRRLKLNHHTNIYQKCEYLQKNYDKYAEEFEQLYLTHNLLSSQVVLLISQMATANLRALVLSHNDLVSDSLKPFKDTNLRNLQYLHLDHNKLSDDACSYIARTNLQSLITLNLDCNRIGTEGCKHLAKANLPNLRSLLLSQNLMNEKGLRYLSLGEWPLLGFVQVRRNSFEPSKELEKIKFRSEMKQFRLQIQ